MFAIEIVSITLGIALLLHLRFNSIRFLYFALGSSYALTSESEQELVHLMHDILNILRAFMDFYGLLLLVSASSMRTNINILEFMILALLKKKTKERILDKGQVRICEQETNDCQRRGGIKKKLLETHTNWMFDVFSWKRDTYECESSGPRLSARDKLIRPGFCFMCFHAPSLT